MFAPEVTAGTSMGGELYNALFIILCLDSFHNTFENDRFDVFNQLRLRMSDGLGVRHSQRYVRGRTPRALLRDLGLGEMPQGQTSGVVATRMLLL